VVGWRAFVTDPAHQIVAIGKSLIPAATVEEAMRRAVPQVRKSLGQPKVEIGIRYCKEKK
jgi:hypothetical protein